MSVIRHDAIPRKTEPSNATADHPSRRPRSLYQPLGGPLFDARFRRHVNHICRLGPRPVGELLLQLVGTQDDARTALIVLLERYGELDAGVVQALGADVFPPAPLHEVQG